MGKIYATGIICAAAFLIYYLAKNISYESRLDKSLFIVILFLSLFSFALLYLRIHLIKSRSNFYWNRQNKYMYYREGKYLLVGDWSSAKGGMQSKMEFTGRAVSVTHSLILHMLNQGPPASPSKPAPEAMFITIDGNDPSDARVAHVAQVWEYIRHFMAQGPSDLPLPPAPHWWNIPHNNICLTPREAVRHYVPWRTGEPGEMQGKKNWMLPFWALLFPYNLFAALCWWAACRLFRVRPATPPPEAFEGETGPLVTIEMAARGVRS
ncbi:hypothetical protein AB4Z48_25015 [Cupriavidus sp. 2TAF22]|uniref:hypothetical protein n=1 Tax=unclassified Cupriavidus TaxID=2640874 RepID=UPI003F8F3481